MFPILNPPPTSLPIPVLGLSWSMQDLVSWSGSKPGHLHWESQILATGPPGKSPPPITFICAGRPKDLCDLLHCGIRFTWGGGGSGSKSTASWTCAWRSALVSSHLNINHRFPLMTANQSDMLQFFPSNEMKYLGIWQQSQGKTQFLAALLLISTPEVQQLRLCCWPTLMKRTHIQLLHMTTSANN